MYNIFSSYNTWFSLKLLTISHSPNFSHSMLPLNNQRTNLIRQDQQNEKLKKKKKTLSQPRGLERGTGLQMMINCQPTSRMMIICPHFHLVGKLANESTGMQNSSRMPKHHNTFPTIHFQNQFIFKNRH